MRALGIHIEGETLKVALLCKIKNKIHVEWTQSLARDVNPLDMLENKPAIVVTGLGPLSMVRREVSLKLKNERAILAALPFQVETLIPYPAEETILIPRFYPNKTVLFATTKCFLKSHLEQMQAYGINPDVVSATGVALARWGEWSFSEQKNLCLLQSGCCVLFSEGKVEILQAYENIERAKAYVLTKCPEVHFASVEDEYAVPIGLALDALQKNGLQFRQEAFSSRKAISQKAKWARGYIAACLLLAFLIGGVGFYKTTQFENQLKERIYRNTESSSLKEMISDWQVELFLNDKSLPLVSTMPSVSDVLAWISSKKQEIEVVRLHYALVKYPKIGEKQEPYQVKVDLEFNAPSPAIAREFHDSLLKKDPFVNSSQEVTWTISQNLYKTSFCLRPQ